MVLMVMLVLQELMVELVEMVNMEIVMVHFGLGRAAFLLRLVVLEVMEVAAPLVVHMAQTVLVVTVLVETVVAVVLVAVVVLRVITAASGVVKAVA